jgi:hypothetical protein
MSKRLQIYVLLSVVAASLALTSAVPARILPEERRIGKVDLFMSEKAVREKLGPPDKIRRIRFDSRADVRRLIYRQRKLRLDLSVDERIVYEISTRNPRQQTRVGSGVGSTRRQLERNEDERLHCEDDRIEGDCWIKPRGQHSAYYTYFLIENRRVVEILVREAPRPL